MRVSTTAYEIEAQKYNPAAKTPCRGIRLNPRQKKRWKQVEVESSIQSPSSDEKYSKS